MRTLALLALLCALAGCDDSKNEILVTNGGSQGAVVDIHYTWREGDDWFWPMRRKHQIYEVSPGTTEIGEYPHNSELKVLIYRKSDGFVLLSTKYDGGDFSDSRRRIKIAVYP